MAAWEIDNETSVRLEGIWGARVGSAGSPGDVDGDVPLRLPNDLGGLVIDGTPTRGGEYWVPASTVSLVEGCVDRLDVDKGRL